MTSKFAALAVSIALVSIGGATLPAAAADMNGNGHRSIKDRGPAGVPVPAPVPYEEHYKYYVGGSLGWTFGRSGSLSATGPGGVDIGVPFGEHVGPASLSITAGRYVTPSIRLELGLDLRSPTKVARGNQEYQVRIYGVGPEVSVYNPSIGSYEGPSQNYNVYNVAHSEDTKHQVHTLMVNALYDFNRGGKLNPYIGAGLGISMHMLHRNYRAAGACIHGYNDYYDLYGNAQPGTCHNQADLPATFSNEGKTSSTGLGFAAAVMAGINYKLTERTTLDVGYRAIYQGGTVAIGGTIARGITTNVSVGNVLDHEVRTGLRFDLW
jgi:opacity protein-like surface antigen